MGQCRTRAMHKCIQHVVTFTRPSKCVACLSSTVFWTSIASRGVRGALLGSHGSRRARSSGSRGVPVGLSWGSPRGFRRTFLGVRSGSRMALVGLSSGSPGGSREALVGLFGARLGSVGLLISPCHLPSSSLLVILLLSSGSVGLRRAPPLSFSSSLWAPSGSRRWVLKPFELSWAKPLGARIQKPTRQQRGFSRRASTTAH